jgi:hypothetical protein
MFTPQVELRRAPSQRGKPAELLNRLAWGPGFGLARTDSANLFWQWGDYGDAKAFVTGDASRRTAIVYFANAQTGLTIAANIVSMVFPGEQYPLRMLGYPSIDDQARLARRAIVRAALDSGAAAGARRLEELRVRHPEWVTWQLVSGAVDGLGGERALAAADTLLSVAQRYWPDSMAVPMARGDLHLTIGADTRRAQAYYRQALDLAPSDSAARARLEWTLQDVEARQHPADLGDAAMRRLIGTYGRVTIVEEHGRLYCRRGTGPWTALVAITPDTLALDNDPSARLRFIVDSSGVAPTVIELSYDGAQARHDRTN